MANAAGKRHITIWLHYCGYYTLIGDLNPSRPIGNLYSCEVDCRLPTLRTSNILH